MPILITLSRIIVYLGIWSTRGPDICLSSLGGSVRPRLGGSLLFHVTLSTCGASTRHNMSYLTEERRSYSQVLIYLALCYDMNILRTPGIRLPNVYDNLTYQHNTDSEKGQETSPNLTAQADSLCHSSTSSLENSLVLGGPSSQEGKTLLQIAIAHRLLGNPFVRNKAKY